MSLNLLREGLGFPPVNSTACEFGPQDSWLYFCAWKHKFLFCASGRLRFLKSDLWTKVELLYLNNGVSFSEANAYLFQSCQGSKFVALFIWFSLQLLSSLIWERSSCYWVQEGFHWSDGLLEDSISSWFLFYLAREQSHACLPSYFPIAGIFRMASVRWLP